MGEKPRYVRIRSDMYNNQKMAWTKAIHRDLINYTNAQNHLGVLDKNMMCVIFDTREDQHTIESALSDLVDHCVFKYYPELGRWWNVECGDEQLNGNSWKSAFDQWEKLPDPLFSDVCDRYLDELWSARGDRKTKVVEMLQQKIDLKTELSAVSVTVPVSVINKEEIAAAFAEAKGWLYDRKVRKDGNAADVREACAKVAKLGGTTEEFVRNIWRQARSLRQGDREHWKYMSLPTIYAKKNWFRLSDWDHLDHVGSHQQKILDTRAEAEESYESTGEVPNGWMLRDGKMVKKAL